MGDFTRYNGIIFVDGNAAKVKICVVIEMAVKISVERVVKIRTRSIVGVRWAKSDRVRQKSNFPDFARRPKRKQRVAVRIVGKKIYRKNMHAATFAIDQHFVLARVGCNEFDYAVFSHTF